MGRGTQGGDQAGSPESESAESEGERRRAREGAGSLRGTWRLGSSRGCAATRSPAAGTGTGRGWGAARLPAGRTGRCRPGCGRGWVAHGLHRERGPGAAHARSVGLLPSPLLPHWGSWGRAPPRLPRRTGREGRREDRPTD